MKKINYLLSACLLMSPAIVMAGGSMCAHGQGGCSSKGIVGFACLLTLALGYWVLRTASGDKGYTKRIGQIAGWVIFLVSFAGLVCTAIRCIKQCKESRAVCPAHAMPQQNIDDNEGAHEAEHPMPMHRMKK